MKRQNYCYDSRFFCLNCGQEGIYIPRKKSHRHAKDHRKKIYCPWCQEDVNHLECKTQEEVWTFKENFVNGVYKDEAADSISYVRAERIREEHLV